MHLEQAKHTDKLRAQIDRMLDDLPRDADPIDTGTLAGSLGLDEAGFDEAEIHQLILEEAAKRDIAVGKGQS